MKKRFVSLLIGLFSVSALVACGGSGETVSSEATYQDTTKNSIYGQLYDFDKTEVKAGDTLTFKVKPSKYFYVDTITNNGKPCNFVYRDPETNVYTYSTVIVPGKNKLAGKYQVDSEVDFVDEFKLDISQEIFEEVMKRTQSKEGEGKYDDIDFRRSGIEQCRAPMGYKNGQKVDVKKEIDSNYFINYVDGDTTHV